MVAAADFPNGTYFLQGFLSIACQEHPWPEFFGLANEFSSARKLLRFETPDATDGPTEGDSANGSNLNERTDFPRQDTSHPAWAQTDSQVGLFYDDPAVQQWHDSGRSRNINRNINAESTGERIVTSYTDDSDGDSKSSSRLAEKSSEESSSTLRKFRRLVDLAEQLTIDFVQRYKDHGHTHAFLGEDLGEALNSWLRTREKSSREFVGEKYEYNYDININDYRTVVDEIKNGNNNIKPSGRTCDVALPVDEDENIAICNADSEELVASRRYEPGTKKRNRKRPVSRRKPHELPKDTAESELADRLNNTSTPGRLSNISAADSNTSTADSSKYNDSNNLIPRNNLNPLPVILPTRHCFYGYIYAAYLHSWWLMKVLRPYKTLNSIFYLEQNLKSLHLQRRGVGERVRELEEYKAKLNQAYSSKSGKLH